MNIQPTLEDEKVLLYPLRKKDFETLYAVASDPEIWEQNQMINGYDEPSHPRK